MSRSGPGEKTKTNDRKNLSGGTIPKLIILQPDLDQSIAIARYLKRYSGGFYITGRLSGKRGIFQDLPYYDEIEEPGPVTNPSSDDQSLVIPTGARSTWSEITNRGSIRVGDIVFDKDNLVVFDKIKMLQVVKDIGIPTPHTCTDIEQLPEFPIFFKERYERGGGARGVLAGKSDIKKIPPGKDLIFQEYIDSPFTFGVGFLADNGELITSFTHKEIVSYPRAGGSGVVLTRYDDPRLIEYTKKILDHLNYSGWGLAEFKYCPKRGDYVFMEVNAKFWASIEFAFLNNSLFLKKLFNLEYTEPETSNIIFMDRLALYGLGEYLKINFRYKGFYRIHIKKSFTALIMYYLIKANKILKIR